jgi:coenzyme PQQ synthesis protein D (PqqD)
MQMPPDGAGQDQILRQSPDVVSSRLGDAGVLVNLRTNRILELNATGIRIWELIGSGQDLSGITSRLLEEFDVTPDQLQRELSRLVADLVREGLVDAGRGE